MWGCSFLQGVEGHIKVRYYRIWKLFDRRYNVVEITFSKKVKYIIRITICFFKLLFIYLFIYSFFSLLNKQRTTQINFANSHADHICFCFSKREIKYFLAGPFQIYAQLLSPRHEGTGISLFFCGNKIYFMAIVSQTLWNSLGLHKMMFSKLAASYISAVSVSFFLF